MHVNGTGCVVVPVCTLQCEHVQVHVVKQHQLYINCTNYSYIQMTLKVNCNFRKALYVCSRVHVRVYVYVPSCGSACGSHSAVFLCTTCSMPHNSFHLGTPPPLPFLFLLLPLYRSTLASAEEHVISISNHHKQYIQMPSLKHQRYFNTLR